MALAKKHRLRSRRDFQAVYRRGISRKGYYLTLRALLESNNYGQVEAEFHLRPSCFGISISQKVSKKAVIRNRIKRRLHGVIRELLPLILPGWKVVVVVRPEAVACEYEHFFARIRKVVTES